MQRAFNPSDAGSSPVMPININICSGDATAAYRSSKPGVRVQVPFRALIPYICGLKHSRMGVLLFVVKDCERVNIDVGVAPFEWRLR